ncbi:MAG: DUF456 domain-containing protein [Weeksellaceae bacterium]|nr:DUF456 domain-containing protein [Weeksellaceae bacterium]
MDELAIKIIFGLVMVIGILGSILPVLPGLPLVFGALLLAKILGYSSISWWLISFFGFLTVLGLVLDYLIPVATSKKLGGSRYGLIGLTIGFVVGLIFAPVGLFSIIVMPFLGALVGELIYDRKSHRRALKAASGSVIGYFLSIVYGLTVSFLMFGFYLFKDIL